MATAINSGSCRLSTILSSAHVRFRQSYPTRPSVCSPSPKTAARTLASSSSSSFAGVSLTPTLNFGLVFTKRGTVVKVRAGKAALACTKRSRSRLSRARTSGFRVRLRTPGGRNVLRRRRAKGRKVLCPCSNPYSGKRA